MVKMLHFPIRTLWPWPVMVASAVVLIIVAANFLSVPFDYDYNGPSVLPLHLRVMPLGDSITEGARSSDGNGYRLQLLQKLTRADSTAEYVGTLRHGDMENNQNEGYGGFTIRQISSQDGLRITLGQKPNVILLHAGTNDMNTNSPEDPFASAPQRLSILIDQVISACPTAVVVVAQIILCSCPFAGSERRIPVFNDEIQKVVDEKAKHGHRILTTDMSSIGVNGSDLADGLHPDDIGYGKMAAFWFEAIGRASRQGWIEPLDVESVP